ncbi:MAG: DUF3306 domain-containing protein [Bradyrhizobium sp.]|uniref:DUF3306 domain-containing protein n=1 Tax=Bradyrhizobium sp. TaxID=376 RepID=UPI0025C23959|nr:DUF3306 domain-containing protein [Bradyrhizobium sp.]MBI5263303.1 DUF3306 domain-containing protein [Bradyrhizobium sp.]
MSEEEFLARWFRRKREARANVASAQTAEPGDAPSPASAPRAETGAPEFDLSSLPPIGSITATTDVTAFLRKGVPQELTRAALRRAWVSDPAIRDFVGLAENAWDFNDPNAMPGFGPLDSSPAELEALVDRVVGAVRKAAEYLPETSVEVEDSAGSTADHGRMQAAAVAEVGGQSALVEPSPAAVASQPLATEKAEREGGAVRHRTHGGALPR